MSIRKILVPLWPRGEVGEERWTFSTAVLRHSCATSVPSEQMLCTGVLRSNYVLMCRLLDCVLQKN